MKVVALNVKMNQDCKKIVRIVVTHANCCFQQINGEIIIYNKIRGIDFIVCV